ncbi:unnamed protein product [Rotaria sp. Silwood2]|nr:unnamed protein product [Rotaria sp. Silwood2]CAF2536550.1 unnamed protein product [Rotaria sp. Silwood2]CAF2788751.1 unnamed protein product [Rotaria sp. Silwood2]CAF2933801.1 unnamed protein product [Rotaria sp. Silwood2]CAF4292777.1 unnamed protein product [Rotaria sp. Silwood2]
MDLLRLADKFSGILSLANVRAKADDFLIDRLNYKFTSAVLCGFALFCGVRSSYTVPIICWTPAQLRRYERAITAYCYANNTYYIPDDRRVPSTTSERYENLIIYYQWLPWIFAIQAFLFFLPKIIWHLALLGSRHDVKSLLDAADKLYVVPNLGNKKPLSKYRLKQLEYLNRRLFNRENGDDIIIHSHHRNSRIFSCYLIICYIGIKCLYFLNCLVQISLIHLMIGTRPFGINRFKHLKEDTFETHFIGQFLNKISSGVSELIDTSAFPKRTLCDFTFRELASNHAYTVECILPLNIIVEKMYVFLYIWFIFLAFIIFIDFIKWIGHLIHCLVNSDKTREHYVRTHLFDRTKYSSNDISRFAKDHLTGNNYFLLKLLSKNISSFVVVDMLDYYFKIKTM